MSVVAENHATQFNPTLSSAHEDCWKNREVAGGFSTWRTIWRGTRSESADTYQSHTGQVSRLLVWATERSAPVSCSDVCVVAVSHGPSTRCIRGHDARDTEKGHRGDRDMTTSPTNRRRFLSIEETADYTGLSVNTLYKMVSHRRIPFVKMGRLTKFDVVLLDAWIKQNTVMPMLPKVG